MTTISFGAVELVSVSSNILLAAELIAACGKNYALANLAWAHAKYENFQGWDAVDAAHTAMTAAGAELTAAIMAAGPEIGGRSWDHLDRNDGQPEWGWLAADMATTTTPAQRRTVLALAVAHGHEWADCPPSVWIDHGVAVWGHGHPGMPGGLGPVVNHTTATGRTRWEVQADGSVTWEVWRGPRYEEDKPAECVLRGVTSPAGEAVIEWRSPLAEDRHECAVPRF